MASGALFCRRSVPALVLLSRRGMPVARRTACLPKLLSYRFASKALLSPEDNLKLAIDSEIRQIESVSNSSPLEAGLPEEFPFEVINNHSDHGLLLRQEFGGETIEATVYMNSDDVVASEDDDDDSDDADQSLSPHFQIFVKITKGEGPRLEFYCTCTEDKLEIEHLTIKKQDESDAKHTYEGPKFNALDKTLQDALKRYLKARGIRRSLYDFLFEYMMAKEDKEYVSWLKSMKEFITV